jgi:hypothetical protein
VKSVADTQYINRILEFWHDLARTKRTTVIMRSGWLHFLSHAHQSSLLDQREINDDLEYR